MINLFEYQNKVGLQPEFDGLEEFLDDIWNRREKGSYFLESEDSKIESQRFLQFIHKTNEIKSNKYVGVIHYQGKKINLLPKIFYDGDKVFTDKEVSQIQNHILWWLSYCRKIKFPNYKTSMGSIESDFFEVLIYLFSKYTRTLLTSSIYQQYEEVSNELSFIKGKLNTNKYINENLARGRWQMLNCTYDNFVIDNEFNRIIKYVATLLFNASCSSENKKNLRDILFILNEVTDERATADQCSRISFNPLLQDFETVRDYCQLFLSNGITVNFQDDFKLFAFLLPMEYVFEDFIFGFVEKEIEQIKAKPQRSDTYLDEEKNFKLRPDLFLKTPSKSIIADTKYKIVYSDEKDPKKGISQSDLYQMLAYAVRFDAKEIILFYPDNINQRQYQESEIIIKDILAGGIEISVKAFQLPIINKALLQKDLPPNIELSVLFEQTKQELKGKLEKILMIT
jgi:5-methylcytosine-specific restriction enzyme subunit McrC